MNDLIADFMAAAASLGARDGPSASGFASIGELMRRLGQQTEVVDEGALASLHGSSASAAVIGRHASGSILMLARFPSETPTPIHNHNSWGVVCVIKGRDRYERWRRLDDSSARERADVRMVEQLTLGPGDVVGIDAPPQDLHAQQGIDEPVLELVYFGRDALAEPRAYFDPASGTVTYAAAIR